MSSLMYTGTCCLPLCTEIVKPTIAGLIIDLLDHVLIGYSSDNPKINLEEVAAFNWMPLDEIEKDLKQNPKNYTVWFAIIFDRFYKHILNQKIL